MPGDFDFLQQIALSRDDSSLWDAVADTLITAKVSQTEAIALRLFAATTNTALPPPPPAVLASAGNAGATVQWTSNHPLPTSWIVTASSGASVVVPATATQGVATFPRGTLTNGTPCTFTVAAATSAGTGRASVASNSVTPTALPFSVLPITRGLEFWWSSAQATSPGNGNPLTSLADFSGNGYNFAGQGGGGTWVTSWSGGKPAVALNGSSQFYDALATGYYAGMRGPACTIYTLRDVQAQPAAVSYVLSAMRPDVNSGALAQGFGFGNILGTAGRSNDVVFDNIVDYFGSGTQISTGSDVVWGTPIRSVVTLPGALRVNAAAVTGNLGPRLYAGVGRQPWTMGCMYAGGFARYLQGRVAEIIICSVVHTPAEIALMETYLVGRF